MTTNVATRPEDIAAAVGVPVGALAIRSDQTGLTEAQRAALGHIGLANAPKGDVEAFMHLCQRTKLDPWARQIYLIERGGRWTPQTAIDGFRVIAERHEQFAGTTDILWCGEDGAWTDIWLGKGTPYAARCSVKRHDREEVITATALFTEFTAGNTKWRNSPAWMIGKCAEAGALRRAFPQDFAGLYIDEEMDAVAAQGRRPRVPSHRDAGPVDVSELTGQSTSDSAPPVPSGRVAAARAARPDLPDGTQMITGKQEKELGKLFDDSKVTDKAARLRVVATLADRQITSSRQLSHDEARDLLSHLHDLGPDSIAALADAANKPSEPVDAEVVDDPAAAPASGEPTDAEWSAMEADRDAAQGTLDDASADR